ncbi:hypothetical protein [Streptacidiphilus sp. PB12-B1b]|uniref:hypothetical protein n=1 Tax=Streptacidiphilus sp. PB12-B1b TaxID=2705012 RepID=UPI001CDB5736|nr:hypothetical protein [Streptacidiphilus sp. PB12-B1b]
MSLLATLARLQAVRSGRAEPLATVLHRHLAERPMVLVPLAAAGEAGAPLAVMLGRDRERPRLLTVPQPLDRDRRFAFLADLADELLPYLESFGQDVEILTKETKDAQTGERTEVSRELCLDAPQLVVPNRGGVELLGLLGRSTRFRRTAEDPDPGPYPAPARVPLLGRHLTHLRERSQVPGSSMLVAMTDLLSRHWATGQSALEDQHLGALLGWIDPPPGLTGAQAALHAETGRDDRGQLLCPPAGPSTDPHFDSQLLAPAINRYDAARQAAAGHAADRALVEAREQEVNELLAGVLRPVWEQLWHGLELLRTLPAAGHLAERWTGDRWSYTAHRDRIAAGEPPQPIRDDAVTAARKLAQREREQTTVGVQEALDDPLAMAERRLAGEALVGTVTAVEPEYDTSRRTPRPRPLLTVRTADRPHAEPGQELHRAGGPGGQRAVLVAAGSDGEGGDDSGGGGADGPGSVTLRLVSGMGLKKEPAPGSVPEVGETVCFTVFELTARQSAPLPEPEDTPWTHGGPPGTLPAGTVGITGAAEPAGPAAVAADHDGGSVR